LLMTCSAVLSDTINPEIAIRYMQKNYFNDLPQPFLWREGSGLSRYNLFTPKSIVKLWEKIYEKVPRERLFPLLAIGGKTGTVKNYYKNEPPYIYGKTGTVSNVHSLSGYLVTKKGRTLIFCFMSNNYVVPTRELRVEMEKILKDIYLHY
jgi:D-alanyl-D-alanine carboxypeptidase/D-alanyl-D-alanine-endopeptidase (penicillin-binding protein 4)